MAGFGSLKPREVLRALLKVGFYIHEQTGSHVRLKHLTKPGRVTVPITRGSTCPADHPNIIRQAGLTNDEFADLLNE